MIVVDRVPPPLKQPHLDVILLVCGELIRLRPAFVLHVGDDVLSGHRSGCVTEAFDGFANAGVMMPLFAMANAIRLAARDRIAPAVDFFIALTEEPDRLLAMRFKF